MFTVPVAVPNALVILTFMTPLEVGIIIPILEMRPAEKQRLSDLSRVIQQVK